MEFAELETNKIFFVESSALQLQIVNFFFTWTIFCRNCHMIKSKSIDVFNDIYAIFNCSNAFPFSKQFNVLSYCCGLLFSDEIRPDHNHPHGWNYSTHITNPNGCKHWKFISLSLFIIRRHIAALFGLIVNINIIPKYLPNML